MMMNNHKWIIIVIDAELHGFLLSGNIQLLHKRLIFDSDTYNMNRIDNQHIALTTNRKTINVFDHKLVNNY